jgi:hypothetical protein
MFGRFRRTNDPARETDGGAVAVEERNEPATSVAAPEHDRVADPATSVAAPAADPAARERRLAELDETQAGDPDTRAVQRDRVVEQDRFARDEAVPARDEPVPDRDDEAVPARDPDWVR